MNGNYPEKKYMCSKKMDMRMDLDMKVEHVRRTEICQSLDHLVYRKPGQLISERDLDPCARS